jgi:hypothetical protein
MTVKRLVCLANSRKLSHRCVAGKELTGPAQGTWVRPVSGREHGEVDLFERRCADGRDPEVMDIIDVPLERAQPKNYQQENWLIAKGKQVACDGSLPWGDLQNLVDPPGNLWVNGQSTARGLNDQIALPGAAALMTSLRLLRVPSMKLSVFTYYGKKRVQGSFSHEGANYWLWVTDPRYEEPYKAKHEGVYDIGESFLTISLSEPFVEKNACYKLIAAIMERPRGPKP